MSNRYGFFLSSSNTKSTVSAFVNLLIARIHLDSGVNRSKDQVPRPYQHHISCHQSNAK